MNQYIQSINYQKYASMLDLALEDQHLIQQAVAARSRAYAPYSDFLVGAAVLLENGTIIQGNNQENAAYPSGLCAERVAIFFASAQFPDQKILKIAISAWSNDHSLNQAVSPCGACRQSLYEYEYKQGQPISIFFCADHSEIYQLNSIQDLLPFSFQADMM